MALVYGVLGLIVILTAGTFGTINASPWFNLGIAVAVRRAGAGDVRRDRRSTSRGSRRGSRSPTRAAARSLLAFTHGRGRGAARRRLRRAGRHPGRAVLEQPVRDGHDGRAGAAVRARPRHGAAVADRRRRHRRAAEAGRRGWCASSRRSACSSWPPRPTTATSPTSCFANRWVDAAEVDGERRGEAEGRLVPSLAEGLAAAEREHKPVLIDIWATWCKNCLTMDKTTLADPEVERGAGRLREDQVPGGESRRAAGRRRDAALRRHRPADLRHPETALKLSRGFRLQPEGGRSSIIGSPRAGLPPEGGSHD